MMGAYMYAWMDPRKKFHKKSISSFIVSLKHVWTNLLGMREITISWQVFAAQQPLSTENPPRAEYASLSECTTAHSNSGWYYAMPRCLRVAL